MNFSLSLSLSLYIDKHTQRIYTAVCRMDRMIINQQAIKILTLLFLLVTNVCSTATVTNTAGSGDNVSISTGEEEGLFVPMEPMKYQIYSNGSSNDLKPGCYQCRCCLKTPPHTCKNVPNCCYVTRCNLPHLPHGACAVVAQSCTCTAPCAP